MAHCRPSWLAAGLRRRERNQNISDFDDLRKDLPALGKPV
jgi:hypothetical protein